LQRDPQNNSKDQQQAFGVFFIAIAISVAVAAIISEIAFLNELPLYYYAIIWIGSFAITFVPLFYNKYNVIRCLKNRMKNSIRWPTKAKVINGVCWAGPFAAIAIFPSYFPYLILVGIGLGNISTYLLLKGYNRIKSHEQLITGLISLVAIPITFEVHTSLSIVRGDIAIMLSRILISIAYVAGGIYAMKTRK
jgi:hypothetical protein